MRKLRQREFKSFSQDHTGFGPTPLTIMMITKYESSLASDGEEVLMPSLEDPAGSLIPGDSQLFWSGCSGLRAASAQPEREDPKGAVRVERAVKFGGEVRWRKPLLLSINLDTQPSSATNSLWDLSDPSEPPAPSALPSCDSDGDETSHGFEAYLVVAMAAEGPKKLQ